MRITGFVFLFVFSILCANAPVMAQDDFSNLPPLKAGSLDEAAPIRMSPEGPAIIKLSQDASSVIIGNPAHATAILENPRLIMLVPQQPGATKIMALDQNGKMLLNRQVLVGGRSSKSMRINRACSVSARPDLCQPVAMYYCPDRCYETALPAADADTAATGDINAPVTEGAAAPVAVPSTPPAGPVAETPSDTGEQPAAIEE